MGGPTFPPGSPPTTATSTTDTRRSVYAPVFRNALPELFEVFDFADPSMVVGRRDASTVAPQALFLMNHPFVLEQARHAARRLLAEPGRDDPGRIDRAYRLALGRPPTAAELRIGLDCVDEAAPARRRGGLGDALPGAVRVDRFPLRELSGFAQEVKPMLRPIRRRDLLKNAACGFGYLALAGLAAERAAAGPANPLAPRPPHFAPRAKRVIFLFMQGGVSQVDSFDYKPRLATDDGKKLAFDDARILANTGMRGSEQRVMKPLWPFAQHGQSGRWGSGLFPEINRHVDDLCFIHSMHTEGVAHGPATLFLHCGATNFVRPSMGSWVLYGLGTENENLPGFVSIAPSAGNGGARNYGNAFLPAVYQGTALGKAGAPASEATIRNLTNASLSSGAQTPPVRPAPGAERRAAPAGPRRLRAGGGRLLVRAGLADAEPCPGRARPGARDRRRRGPSTASASRRPTTSAASACWRGGCASRASASSR